MIGIQAKIDLAVKTRNWKSAYALFELQRDKLETGNLASRTSDLRPWTFDSGTN